MPGVILLAKQVKAKLPRVKYRNMKITETGISAQRERNDPELR